MSTLHNAAQKGVRRAEYNIRYRRGPTAKQIENSKRFPTLDLFLRQWVNPARKAYPCVFVEPVIDLSERRKPFTVNAQESYFTALKQTARLLGFQVTRNRAEEHHFGMHPWRLLALVMLAQRAIDTVDPEQMVWRRKMPVLLLRRERDRIDELENFGF